MRYSHGHDESGEDEMPSPREQKPPEDSIDNSIVLEVTGTSLEGMQEFARLEAARIFGVPPKRIKVQLHGNRVATRDPFPTDLNSYARPNTLASSATCYLVEDPNMPRHDRME